jgi:hypothetical protein
VVYADDVNILGGSIHTVKQNTDILAVASEETGQEVNPEKTKYMIMSRDQTTGQNQNIKAINNFFEGVQRFIYLGTTLTN